MIMSNMSIIPWQETSTIIVFWSVTLIALVSLVFGTKSDLRKRWNPSLAAWLNLAAFFAGVLMVAQYTQAIRFERHGNYQGHAWGNSRDALAKVSLLSLSKMNLKIK
jgi:membrane associated rhomboid family serine protease